MKIAVIAANGRSGRVFVEHALANGHIVRAGIYGDNTLPIHPNLAAFTCDATDEKAVEELVADCDAVVSFIGHVKNSPDNVQTDAIKVVVKAMKKSGIKRIVSLTGTGVRFPGDRITLLDRVLNLAVSIVDPKRVRDGKNHVVTLQESGLDWTVLRVLKLQGSRKRPFRLSANGPTKAFVSRQDVATAAIEVLEQRSFICQAPILAKR